MRATIVSIAMLLGLTACAAPPAAIDGRPLPRFLSLSPESLGRSLSLSKIVTGEYGGKTYRMRYEVEITPARLAIVGLSPLGVTLFTLIQEQGGSMTVTQPGKNAPFDPRHILFDLYLTYWPREILQAALSSLSLRLDQNAAGSVRRVLDANGEPVAEIAYPPQKFQKGGIVIRHFDIPYRLRIVTLEAVE